MSPIYCTALRLVLLVVFILRSNEAEVDPYAVCDPGPCGPGQYLKGQVCEKCQEGTYLNKSTHGCRDCHTCTKDRIGQIIVEQCTATQDTKFTCGPDLFSIQVTVDHDFACMNCSKCPDGSREIIPCSGTRDTVCEPKSSGSAEETEAGNNKSDIDSAETTSSNQPDYHWTAPSGEAILNWTASTERPGSNDPETADDKNIIAVVIITVVIVVVIAVVIIIITKWLLRRRKANQNKALQPDSDKPMLPPDSIEMTIRIN